MFSSRFINVSWYGSQTSLALISCHATQSLVQVWEKLSELLCFITSEKMLRPILSVGVVCLQSHMKTVYRFRKRATVDLLLCMTKVTSAHQLQFADKYTHFCFCFLVFWGKKCAQLLLDRERTLHFLLAFMTERVLNGFDESNHKQGQYYQTFLAKQRDSLISGLWKQF